MMEYTVYFADKSVVFTAERPVGEPLCGILPDDGCGVTRDKVLKFLETRNCAVVVSGDPTAAFEAFAAEFTPVEAAGGIVVADGGEWLMIHRNGRWDLPKGHVEPGESADVCAVREIAEETGVAARVVRPLCETLHAYWFPKTARWELKRTHWFELRVTEPAGLQPQVEEGISAAVWCTPQEVTEHLREAFPTIRRVAASLLLRDDARTD